MNRGLVIAGISSVAIGFFALIYGLSVSYLCPLQYYQNGQIVGGGCGNVPLIIPSFGIACIIIGAILLGLSFVNHFHKEKTSQDRLLERKGITLFFSKD